MMQPHPIGQQILACSYWKPAGSYPSTRHFGDLCIVVLGQRPKLVALNEQGYLNADGTGGFQ